MSYYLMSFIIVGIVFGGVLLLLLERMVLVRLARLSVTVNTISASGKLDQRIVVDGTDELATLAIHVNDMLAGLERSQGDLQTANQLLENRVMERTVELSRINGQLRQEIEERGRTQQELALARDQALESLQLKAQILANVGHDSRTPLNAITGYAEMLLEQVYGAVNEQQRRAVQRIIANAQDLLVFINNLLDSAKLEGNALQPHYAVFHLGKMLASVEDSILPRARDKGLQLSAQIDPQLPEQIYSDERRIKQILTNLLVNAIKFTDQGSVTVHVFRQDDAHWGLEVRDTGRGIEPDVRERIFEAFWQVDGSPTRRNNSGVGLGLAIVQALVRLFEGEIKVESEVGQGSTFTVILPQRAEQRESVP
jgi:signal transduction histidine kinase